MNLPSPQTLLYGMLLLNAVLIARVVVFPSVTASREGKIFAFVTFFILPMLCGSMAASEHI